MQLISSPNEYEPLILLDGLPSTIEILETMNATQIDRIEVITRVEAMFGAIGANGVIAIYSSKSEVKSDNKSYLDYRQINVSGINVPNIFIQNSKNQTTLYWNPNVFTNEFGKATFKKSVRNTPQNYIIQVFGVDRTGKPSFAQKIFSVN